MKRRYWVFAAAFLILLLAYPLPARRLTYKQAFEGEAYKGKTKIFNRLPSFVRWLDSRRFLQREVVEEKGKTKTLLYVVDIKTGKKQLLDPEAEKILPKGLSLSSYADISQDGSRFIFLWKGDLYLYCAKSRSFRRLTATASSEKNPRLSPDGRWVAYTRDHNLYALNLETGVEHQLTSDGDKYIYNGWASWVYYEEILGRRTRYRAFWWSPDGRRIAFMRFDDRKVPKFTLVRSEGVHPVVEVTPYPKAGDPNPEVKLGVVDVQTHRIVWIKVPDKEEFYLGRPFWSPDGSYLLVQWLNRGQDHLILFKADPKKGDVVKVYEEKQPSWVDFFTEIKFLKDGSLLFISDKDGWPHLYLLRSRGKGLRQITRGSWRVRSIAGVDEKRGVVYITGFKGNSTENHLFAVKLKGGEVKKITKMPGTHRVYLSPDLKYFVDYFQNINMPSKMLLCDRKGRVIRTLADSATDALKEYHLGKVELFTIPSGDGYDLPALWVLPPDFNPSKKYPVLLWIYGGPDAAMVRNRFPSLSWFYLAQEGIIVISVDHRGSGHFGKKGVALMHRNLGKWEMHDYIAAVKWLRKKPFVDPARIGITGGSYGGYVTCMALTYGADYFTHGFAAFPVTDWRLYDTVYTERYMDRPDENPEGYKFGSVLTHAEKLRGKLMIVHGTIDDNVHPQNTFQLISKLQDLKKDFELMMYPGCRHGWGGPKRMHYNRLFVKFWFKYFLGRDFDPEKD